MKGIPPGPSVWLLGEILKNIPRYAGIARAIQSSYGRVDFSVGRAAVRLYMRLRRS
jgi:hypothetical protein